MNMSEIEPNTKESLASHFALQVALQTMKERCQNLQIRLTTVEDENLRLRMSSGIDKPDDTQQLNNTESKYGQNEIELLRDKVGELTRQKVQLTEHLQMVATENRQLWSRLSKLTKDNHTLGSSLIKMKDTLNNTSVTNSNSNNICLIRSKTFTQNSPNPYLRHTKTDGNDVVDYSSDKEEKSLERELKTNSFGFGYLQEDEINDEDVPQNLKRVCDKLQDFKKEILRQQSDLNVTLSNLRKYRGLEVCNSCSTHSNNSDKNINNSIQNEKPKTADKCLETDPLPLPRKENTKKLTESNLNPVENIIQINTTNMKQNSELVEKMCPMCGKIYSVIATFDEFQEHVESHFVDDSALDMDSHIEKNFEIVSHNILDF